MDQRVRSAAASRLEEVLWEGSKVGAGLALPNPLRHLLYSRVQGTDTALLMSYDVDSTRCLGSGISIITPG